jgi:hypothetical protein
VSTDNSIPPKNPVRPLIAVHIPQSKSHQEIKNPPNQLVNIFNKKQGGTKNATMWYTHILLGLCLTRRWLSTPCRFCRINFPSEVKLFVLRYLLSVQLRRGWQIIYSIGWFSLPPQMVSHDYNLLSWWNYLCCHFIPSSTLQVVFLTSVSNAAGLGSR